MRRQATATATGTTQMASTASIHGAVASLPDPIVWSSASGHDAYASQ
jgi:hypothetical protein